MSTITFTVGSPGAGKTRWSHEQVQTKGLHLLQRVNLDDLMTMLQGRSYGVASSADVKLAQRIMLDAIRSVTGSGRDVIVDNTHLSTRFPLAVRDELGDEHVYQIRDFTGLPLETVIRQDLHRREANPGAYVGTDEVTRAWHKGEALRRRYGGEGLPDLERLLNRSDGIKLYEPDESLPRAVIVDVDGTLALANRRSPYDTSLYHTDDLESRLATLIDSLIDTNEPYRIIVLTGRDASHRDTLVTWLAKHHVYVDEIHMRPAGDTRRDNVIKLELFDTHVRDRFNVIAAFDDRDRVVRLWRRLGLFTCQVQYGAF